MAAGRTGKQERTLLRLWLEHPVEGCTDKECQEATGIPANTVSARRNGLMVTWAIQRLPLQLIGFKRRCTVTGHTVIAWKVVQGPAQQMELEWE